MSFLATYWFMDYALLLFVFAGAGALCTIEMKKRIWDLTEIILSLQKARKGKDNNYDIPPAKFQQEIKKKVLS